MLFSGILLGMPIQILKKYKGITPNDLIFPVPNSSSCTYNLKKIANLLEIVLGYLGIRTAQIYAKITNKKISDTNLSLQY